MADDEGGPSDPVSGGSTGRTRCRARCCGCALLLLLLLLLLKAL